MRFIDQPLNLQPMRNVVVRILVLALVFVLIPRPALAQSDEASWLLSQINALRQRNGVAPLTVNAQLTTSATSHSTYLATHPYSDPHREANGSTPLSRAGAAGYPGALVGENVVGGTGASVQWAMNWWVQSPIHLHNMLVDWTEVGIGIVNGPYGKWYTTDFGSPGAGVVPRPAAPVSAGATAQPSANSSNTNSIAARPNLPPPTRRPTRAPTLTPTITFTPSITFTPRPTFTPTLTPTSVPPTGTAIVLEITPETVLTNAPVPISSTLPAAYPSEAVAVAMVETPAAPRPPPAPASPSDGVRSLIPWIIAIQGVIVGGLFAKAILRRRR